MPSLFFIFMNYNFIQKQRYTMKPTPPKKQAAHQTNAKQQASHTMILIKNKYHATLFTQVKAC